MSDSILSIDNLKKFFDTQAGKLEVLKGITLKIHKGEFIAITGASGAGKSTLLHIMGTIDRPSSGTLLYENTDVFQFDDNQLSAFRNDHIGFIFQFHHLLPEFSALENILMPGLISGLERKLLIDKAETLLKDLGIYERKRHRPGELSGGEQQRVAVARALILDPDIVLADEPTGNLDTATGEDLFTVMKRLNQHKGVTIVMVTHNDYLAERCDRILHIKDGSLAELI